MRNTVNVDVLGSIPSFGAKYLYPAVQVGVDLAIGISGSNPLQGAKQGNKMTIAEIRDMTLAEIRAELAAELDKEIFGGKTYDTVIFDEQFDEDCVAAWPFPVGQRI